MWRIYHVGWEMPICFYIGIKVRWVSQSSRFGWGYIGVERLIQHERLTMYVCERDSKEKKEL